MLISLWFAVTSHAAPPPASPDDPLLASTLGHVSADRLQARIERLAAFGTRHTASSATHPTRGIGAARRWIEAELRACAAGTPLQVQARTHLEPAGRRLAGPTEIVNIVATLPGRLGSPRVLVMLGHYDSRNGDVMDAEGDAPGANDDASGTAAVMEAACLAAHAAKTRPLNATIVFAAVAGEEQGLLGAAQLARELDTHFTVEGVITNDIVGSPHGAQGEHAPHTLRLFADGLDPLLRLMLRGAAAEPSPRLKAQQELAAAGGSEDLPTAQFGRHLKQAIETHVPGFQVQLIQRRDRTLRGGDHLPFLERGLAAVRFSEPFENYAHQHQNVRVESGQQMGDLPRFVDPAYVARITQANLAGLLSLAWAPAPPNDVRVDARELSNDTRLMWIGVDGASGYRVLWRRSEAAHWEHALDVGPGARSALLQGVSRDDWVFAVQALDNQGRASLAIYAPPRGS
ncbi:M28 family peptidase [Inhella gelatinilytica]|uniref:M20/M25/M40 family metallo-hydrolase n=1 Tax=Inhella gelatinilytica TaxID=2795030 RepID=A0A931J1E0_9BURK|nr:M28 family peptidase [Inhella gelatinilytica]MBH9553576.1 M20/M25/M40 family metallo-hydrolase [Inhella gelatinilytica]